MTIVLNAANGDGFLPINKDYSYDYVGKGLVGFQTQILSLQTRCELNIEKYPFDKQTCFITSQDWPFYDFDNAIRYLSPNYHESGENLSIGVQNSIWEVVESFGESVSNNTKYNITISLRRKSTFYIFKSFII